MEACKRSDVEAWRQAVGVQTWRDGAPEVCCRSGNAEVWRYGALEACRCSGVEIWRVWA